MANDMTEMARDALLQRMGQGRLTVEAELRTNPVAKAMFDVATNLARDMAHQMDVIPYDYRRFVDDYADIVDLQQWADHMMQMPPHFIIGGDYMHRWHILPRNAIQNLYLHHLLRDDEDVFHDHPWDSTSFIIKGGFIEHTPEGSFQRRAGDVIHRKAEDLHWLELRKDPLQTSVSLFFTGPKRRDWGFQCPERGWVPWQQYTGGYHDGRSDKGAGCGEPS